MKERSILAKKLRLFYEDIKKKRTGKMRLQTDLEFKQNQTKACGGGEHLLQNKKLESLKRFY